MAGGRGERSMLTYQHGTAAIVGPLSVHATVDLCEVARAYTQGEGRWTCQSHDPWHILAAEM